MPAAITLSVVSHGQNRLVNQLLGDLSALRPTGLSVVVTQNIPDNEPLQAQGFEIEVVVNSAPKGFGANHNAAFARCAAPYFCGVNPDIRLKANPFPELLAALVRERVGVAGPRVCSPEGRVEDSARRFPTIGRLLRKLLHGAEGPDYPVDRGPLEVDWVAGMFMLFRSDAFRAVNGFDERFFLYYEDVDICGRLSAMGYNRVYHPEVRILHDAQRASRRNLRLMWIHAASALRYLARSYRQ
jgi:N-acetylglucosaminyl-diphospho-decaprenol L-rhamnosyltransferase